MYDLAIQSVRCNAALIEGDVGELLFGAANDTLATMDVSFKNQHALTVVLASEGYLQSAIKAGRFSVQIRLKTQQQHGLVMQVQPMMQQAISSRLVGGYWQ